MATLTNQAGSVGAAAKRPVYGVGAKPKKIGTYTFTFDSAYPTGGESIADIFTDFNSVEFIAVSGPASRLFEVNYSTQKILVYTAVNTQATNGSDQQTISVKLLVFGS